VSECKIDRSLLSLSVEDVCLSIVVFLTEFVLNCRNLKPILSKLAARSLAGEL